MELLPSETELLDRQRTPQMEVKEVVRDIMHMELAQPLGDPVLVGSAALGLMVWRDLDVTVACPRLEADAVVQFGSRLALHPGICEVVFRNDTGAWNADPAYPGRPVHRPLVSLGRGDMWIRPGRR